MNNAGVKTSSTDAAAIVSAWKSRWSDPDGDFDTRACENLSINGLPASLSGTAAARYLKGATGDVDRLVFHDPSDGSYLVQLAADGGQFVGVAIFDSTGAQLAQGTITEGQLSGI